MARKRNEVEDQIPLIDVEPENAKKIKAAAKAYNKVKQERADLKAKEKSARTKVLELVKDSGVGLVDGQYRLQVGDLIITVTPQDDKVNIREASDDSSDDEGDDANGD